MQGLTWIATGLIFVGSVYGLFVQPAHVRWGATDAEVVMALEGDDIVTAPILNSTHAITIHAPPSEVWPWLMQIGQGRGGFYSYDWLESLFGLHMQSADRLLADVPPLRLGETVALAPGGFGPPVVTIDPPRALVMGGLIDAASGKSLTPGTPVTGSISAMSWGFYLFPVDPDSTRLLVRFRSGGSPGLANTLLNHGFLDPAHFFMQRKMLLGLKERVEQAYRNVASSAPTAATTQTPADGPHPAFGFFAGAGGFRLDPGPLGELNDALGAGGLPALSSDALGSEWGLIGGSDSRELRFGVRKGTYAGRTATGAHSRLTLQDLNISGLWRLASAGSLQLFAGAGASLVGMSLEAYRDRAAPGASGLSEPDGARWTRTLLGVEPQVALRWVFAEPLALELRAGYLAMSDFWSARWARSDGSTVEGTPAIFTGPAVRLSLSFGGI